jgi:hypothetical protein
MTRLFKNQPTTTTTNNHQHDNNDNPTTDNQQPEKIPNQKFQNPKLASSSQKPTATSQ